MPRPHFPKEVIDSILTIQRFQAQQRDAIANDRRRWGIPDDNILSYRLTNLRAVRKALRGESVVTDDGWVIEGERV